MRRLPFRFGITGVEVYNPIVMDLVRLGRCIEGPPLVDFSILVDDRNAELLGLLVLVDAYAFGRLHAYCCPVHNLSVYLLMRLKSGSPLQPWRLRRTA